MNHVSFIPEIAEAFYRKITLNSYVPRNEYKNAGNLQLSSGQVSTQTVSALRLVVEVVPMDLMIILIIISSQNSIGGDKLWRCEIKCYLFRIRCH